MHASHHPVRPRGLRPVLAALALLSLACDNTGDAPAVHKGKSRAQQAESKSSFEDGTAAAPAKKSVSPAALLERARPLLGTSPLIADNPANKLTEEKIELGRKLFYDPRLSKGQEFSCNTCHELDKYGIDTRQRDGGRARTSEGHRKQFGERNTPTVYHAAFALAQFWDGRATDVEQQAQMPITNPVEMAMADPGMVMKVIKSVPGYQALFEAAFPGEAEPITFENLGKAIGAFERKLVTVAPFDHFMQGDVAALDDDQLRGLELFLDAGCTQCHTGPQVGGTQFQKLGSVKPWPDPLVDSGREKHTGSPADKWFFKVPTLRNITETGPYLHDGSIGTLAKMVQLMAEHQTSRGKLTEEETQSLVAFLGSLKGELPLEYIAKPELPENGPNTPGPDPS